ESENGKKVLNVLKELKVEYQIANNVEDKKLTAKDLALGIGRKATQEELLEYIEKADKSPLIDVEDLLKEDDQ
ncbi:MAG: hypothetical protein Q8R57_07395, partial [Bacteroidota bacterium]|nr:hypothetical protein [Bacteroidota bacterium]